MLEQQRERSEHLTKVQATANASSCDLPYGAVKKVALELVQYFRNEGI